MNTIIERVESPLPPLSPLSPLVIAQEEKKQRVIAEGRALVPFPNLHEMWIKLICLPFFTFCRAVKEWKQKVTGSFPQLIDNVHAQY
jgi:hypothetical protein